MNEYDILIIGAGPTGNQAAIGLARLGYQVCVIEKHSNTGHKLCCTGIIGQECMEVFQIDRRCILQEASSAKLFSPSGDFIRISRNEPQACIVDRPMFDQILAERSVSAGAQYTFNHKAEKITISTDYVEVITQRNNDSEIFRGKILIIANGFDSRLPSQANLGQITNTITGAQTLAETQSITETEVFFSHKIAPGFFAWIVPISTHSARIGLFSKTNPAKQLKAFLRQLTQEGKVKSADVDIHYGGIPLKPLQKTYGERVLVIGDAAGQVKPTTGGGIYYGLLCAEFAATTCNSAFEQNDFSKKAFSLYETLWKEKLRRELRLDYFARSLYNRLSDKRINNIFSVVKENNIHEYVLSSSYKSFDWHGEMVLDGLKQMKPWIYLFGSYLPEYVLRSLRFR